MEKIASLSPERYAEMAATSQRMAQELTPDRWAEYFVQKSVEGLKQPCEAR